MFDKRIMLSHRAFVAQQPEDGRAGRGGGGEGGGRGEGGRGRFNGTCNVVADVNNTDYKFTNKSN